MLSKRIIACLDVRDGHVVKGINFEGLRSAGDPAELARRYNREGIDELVILDITTTLANRYGSQAVIVAIDAKQAGTGYAVYARSGQAAANRDAVEWAREA